ncbi:hypothetical protein F5884DRAFT_823773 [Xylogone sp. PMI_703]|nr:hypothetical protein F5884DRAFT_823773 [Xylogone sp. PMI_703]
MEIPNPTTKYHHNAMPITDPTQKHLSAAGKIVLVTGGGTAIGAATVEASAKAQAAHVFLVGRRLHLLEGVANKLSSQYSQTKFHPISIDIIQEDQISFLFNEINKIGPVDILIANAGYLSTPGPLATSNTSEWWRSFETNVLGTYLLAKSFLNQQQSPKSTPVFIGVNTGAAHLGPVVSLPSAYGVSKLAAASILEFIQAENPIIKAFNISPGVVQSEINDKAENRSMTAMDSPEMSANLRVWLAGPDSDFLKVREKIVANLSLLRLTLGGLGGWEDGFAKLK